MSILCQTCGLELATWTGKCPNCGGTMPLEIKAKADPLLGKVVGGRYKVTKKLGQGGMGSVYLAEHLGVGQRVAIKFLNPSFSNDRNVMQRFLNEAKSYGQITHPHAVQLHDFGQDEEGNLYISMEFIEGQDLKKLLEDQGGKLSLRDALDIVLQVCDVLGYAHEKGIVHRDLKPENIMLVKSLRGWHAKVLDFGVARLMAEQTRVTAAGSICGTPRYMAPEQAQGGEADHRVDVYALGLVLFECVTGTHPFVAPTIAETLRRQVMDPMPHLNDVAPDQKLPSSLDAAIQKATAKDPEQRFATMTDFAKVLVPLMPTSQLDAALLQQGVERAQTMVKGEAVHPEKTSHGASPYDRAAGSRSRAGLFAGLGAAAVILAAGGLWLATRPAPLVVPELPAPPPRASDPEPSIKIPPRVEEPAPVARPDPAPVPQPDPVPAPKPPEPAKPDHPGQQIARTPDPRPLPVPAPLPRPDPNHGGVDQIRRVGDESILNLAHVDFEAGRLDTAAKALKQIPADSAVHGAAAELDKQIADLRESLERANALFRQGNCEEAIRLYKSVLARNPSIHAADEGINLCKKQMPAGSLE